MKTEYLKIIPTLGVVEDNEIELASKLFEFKIFQKGDCIIKPGTNSHNIYFLLTGLVYSQNTDGKINWYVWYGLFLENITQRLYYYYQSLLVKDASQRYNELIELHPEILQRIPLGHIASYLGISQVSLSRIRAGKQKK